MIVLSVALKSKSERFYILKGFAALIAGLDCFDTLAKRTIQANNEPTETSIRIIDNANITPAMTTSPNDRCIGSSG